MSVCAARADMVLGDEYEDFWETQFCSYTARVKGVVIRLEPFGGEQGIWSLGRYVGRPKGLTCRFGVVTGSCVPNWIDPYACRGVVCVVKKGV